MSRIHPTKLATAKLSLVRDTALDGELSKLALRLIGIFVGIHMRPEHDGVAWPSTKFMCEQLGVSSESKVRSALYTLLERGYLAAERKAGETTRYRIAERYFDGNTPPPIGATPQPLYGAGSEDTPPPIGATTQPRYGAGRAPPIGATNTVNRKPLIEDRKSPPLNSPSRSGAESNWPGDVVGVSSFGGTPSTFERFAAVWQWGQGESVKQARAAFHRLSESDCESAIQGAPSFQSAMAGRQHPPHASTYLDERKWACRARNASAASQKSKPSDTFKNGVGVLLAESYFGTGAEPKFDAANVIDLEVVRLDHTEPPTASAVEADHLRPRSFVLHPQSPQLEAWRAHERRVHGHAKPGLRRPSEWPPGAPAADGAEVAEGQT